MLHDAPGGPPPRPPGVFTPAFIALSLASFVTYVSVQFLTATLPLYAVRLGADDAALGLLAGVIALTSLAARPWVGWWLDRGGVVPALALGVLAFTISAVGYWLAASVATLLAFRALTGAGIALFTTAGQTLTVNLAPPRRRGEALSLYAISHPVAQIVAPPVGVAIAQTAGFPTLFAVCVATGLLAVALMWPLRAQRAGGRGRTPLVIVNRAVLVPGVWIMALMVPYGANIGLLAVHAARRGLANPGVVFTAMAVGILIVLVGSGRLSDRAGRAAVIAPGMVLAAAGMWATALLGGWALVVAGVLSGLGMGLAQPALFAYGVDLAPPAARGSAVATMGLFLEIGIALGAIGGGMLGRTLGLGLMFGVAGVVPAAGALLIWATARWRPAAA
jgi:MFS family permease